MKKLLIMSVISAFTLTACGGSSPVTPEPAPATKWVKAENSPLVHWYLVASDTGETVDVVTPQDIYDAMPMSVINEAVYSGIPEYVEFYSNVRSYVERDSTYISQIDGYVVTANGIANAEKVDMALKAIVDGETLLTCNYKFALGNEEVTAMCQQVFDYMPVPMDIHVSTFPITPKPNLGYGVPPTHMFKGEYSIRLLNYSLEQLGITEL